MGSRTVVPLDHASVRKSWCVALRDYRRYMVGAGWTEATRDLRMFYARAFADWTTVAPKSVSVSDLSDFMAEHEDWSLSTRQAVVGCLRALFRWMQTVGRRRDNPALSLIRPRVPARPPRPCPESVLAAALAVADDRLRLMVEAAAFCGLRRAEIARMHSDALTRTEDGWGITVHGKGGKVRVVPVSDRMASAVAARPGWTFPGRTDGHLAPATVGIMVARELPGDWTCHTLRHRFASVAYRQDRDIRAVQELLGHTSVTTTQIYTAVPDGAKRRAAAAAYIVAA